MDEKRLYKQKKQAQLDEWKAEIEKFRAKASGASADAQLQLIKHINTLETKIEHGKSKLAEITDASDAAWGSIKDGVESAWASIHDAFVDAANKFKQ